jgi:mono/diheme cytochrome c family protein
MPTQNLGAAVALARAARVVFALAVAAPALAWEPPATLRETGLYSDWEERTVDPAHLPFTPQYPLWSDGAVKLRWISIPRGTHVDASDPNSWEFPFGTRLWKEFRIGGRRVETRYIERTDEGWQFAAYQWSDDEKEASLCSDRGARASAEVAPGVRHAIPSRFDCRACHDGRPVPVLGFSALQLSPERDPNAPHAETPRPGDVDLRLLVERGLVRGLPAALLERPPRIAARSKTERAALGYMYGNCAMCHNARGSLADLGFSLDYSAGQGPRDPDAVLTAASRASRFVVPGAAGQPSHRVRPGDPDRSAIAVRMGSRNPAAQMPPLGTQVVDEEAVRLVRRWIAEDLGERGQALAKNVRRLRKETRR